MEPRRASQSRVAGPVLFGAILILVGALLLLGTLTTFDIGSIWRWLPSALIVIGLWQLYESRGRALTGPLILIAVGVLVQLAVLDAVEWSTIACFWPVIIILAGLSILLGRQGTRGGATASGSDRLSATALFAGVERRITSKDFRGGEVTAIFGGGEVDMRDAEVTHPPATLNVTALFGGVDIKVPEGWRADLPVTAILGGAADERRVRVAPTDGAPQLIVTGVAMFGGGSLKN